MASTSMLGWVDYEILVPRSSPDRCERCSGTGRFVRGTLNGRPAGPGGECFRCLGKGYQDESDRTRNAAFDRHYFAKLF